MFLKSNRINCTSTNGNHKSKFDAEAEEFDKNYKKSLEVSKNVSKILDRLLQGYDKRLRPNYAGPPVTVGITSKYASKRNNILFSFKLKCLQLFQVNINNINSVSEVNMVRWNKFKLFSRICIVIPFFK